MFKILDLETQETQLTNFSTYEAAEKDLIDGLKAFNALRAKDQYLIINVL
jgi:hypothetical protein